ncbi:MAG: hypothetical protein ACOCX4_10485, partial [Planctomycetota bacterium]
MVTAALALVAVLALGSPAAPAAEYRLDGPTVRLQRSQYCTRCGSRLDVTHVRPGETVRCPVCAQEQPRLPDRFLRVDVFQICPGCAAALDVRARAPGSLVRCGACGRVQRVLRAATLRPDRDASGTGVPPDAAAASPVDALP